MKPEKTISVFTGPVAFAQNKYHLTVFNPVDSGIAIKLHRLIGYNLQLTAVTGVGVQFDMKWCDTVVGGTVITPKPYDRSDGIAVVSFTAVTGATSVANEDLLYSFAFNNDEIPLTNANANGNNRIDVFTSNQVDLQHGTLRPGQGITLKQITNSVVGTYGWQMLVSQVPLLD